MPDDREQPPTTPEELRFTYASLGARLGISADAARMLARRRNWQRIQPNRSGAPTIVVVPEDELEGEQWRTDRPTFPDDQGTTPNVPPTVLDASIVEVWREAWIRERDRSDAAERRAEAERERADRAELRAERGEQRVEQAEQRADAATARAESAEADRRNAEAQAERAEADRAEERGRTDRAEATVAAERARADALRERIETLQGQLTARQEVIDAAETTRRAEDKRRAMGRWARVRAAWRGE